MKKYFKVSILFTSLLSMFFSQILFATNTKGQNESLHGKIIDCQSLKPIRYVQVFNESKRRGAVSDSLGLFRILANRGDTLVFISLGYLAKVVTVTDVPSLEFVEYQVCPVKYEIEQVEIAIPGTYKQFKQALLNHQVEETEILGLPNVKMSEVPPLLDTAILGSLGFAVMHPISFFYYKFSKEEKSKRKVFYLQKQELEREIVSRKYNREIVARITSLQNEELTNFIGFCNFSHSFLYYATDLEIIEAIEQKLNLFQKQKNDE